MWIQKETQREREREISRSSLKEIAFLEPLTKSFVFVGWESETKSSRPDGSIMVHSMPSKKNLLREREREKISCNLKLISSNYGFSKNKKKQKQTDRIESNVMIQITLHYSGWKSSINQVDLVSNCSILTERILTKVPMYVLYIIQTFTIHSHRNGWILIYFGDIFSFWKGKKLVFFFLATNLVWWWWWWCCCERK